MKKWNRFKTAMVVIGAALFCTTAVQASPYPDPQFVGPYLSDFLPPGIVGKAVGQYEGAFHEWRSGAMLKDPVHKDFAGLPAPPPPSIPGAFTIHSFLSKVSGNFGVPVFGNADTQVKVTFNHCADPITKNQQPCTPASDRFFDTELLQLDISGGSLPLNVLIREDPDEDSTGLLAIHQIDPTHFEFASFFDVFTELSIDGGLTFVDSVGSTRMTLVAVPEPGSLALLSLALAALAGMGRRATWRAGITGRVGAFGQPPTRLDRRRSASLPCCVGSRKSRSCVTRRPCRRCSTITEAARTASSVGVRNLPMSVTTRGRARSMRHWFCRRRRCWRSGHGCCCGSCWQLYASNANGLVRIPISGTAKQGETR